MPPNAEGDPLLLLSSTIQSPVGGTELEAWGGVTLRQARVSKDGSEGKQANTTSGRRLPQVTSCSGPWFCPVQKGDNTPSHGSTEMAQGECPAGPGPGSQSPSGLGGGGGELSGSCWCCPPPGGDCSRGPRSDLRTEGPGNGGWLCSHVLLAATCLVYADGPEEALLSEACACVSMHGVWCLRKGIWCMWLSHVYVGGCGCTCVNIYECARGCRVRI